MGNYLHKFESLADFNTAYNGSDYHEPWVSYTTYDQALSFTANIIHAGNEFGPYDFTFYEEVNYLSVSLTNVTGTFYIWSYNNGGSHIVTTTRNITENTYYEDASWVEDNGCWSTSDNVGGSGYTLVNISSIVNETKGAIDYNKRPLDYDIEINCNGQSEYFGQEILSMSSRVSPYELSESGSYVYSVTNPNLTTSPLQTIKVKIVNGLDNSDGVYECTYFGSDGYNAWEHVISEDPYIAIRVEALNDNGAWSLQAYLTEGG